MDFAAARTTLLNQLRSEITDSAVLDAMARVPREIFVPVTHQSAAYEDRPLPIGHGQTISQPLIVAMMLQALELKGEEKVLEIGTGSGYEAAILAELSRHVVSVERHADLVTRAQETLARLGYNNIEVHLTEGKLGWKPGAPYDAIVCSAGAPMVPQDLLDQLGTGGRLVIPVGSRWEQELLKVTKKGDDENTYERLGPCRWVPLIGEGAWDD